MKRSGLVLGMLLGLSGCASDSTEYEIEDKKIKVVVIGAGISGLAAAKMLQEDPRIEVTLLEGRGRVGGRVWTKLRESESSLDMGASWIHGTRNNPIFDLAEKLSLETVRTDYSNGIVYNGRGQRDTELFSRLSNFSALFKQELASLIEQDNDDSIQGAVNNTLAEGGQGKASIADIDFLLNTRIEHEFAADVSKLSILALDEGEAFSGQDVIFRDGYTQIVDYLARDLDIKLNQKVLAIDYSDSRIKITTSMSEFFADRVLVTVPLGVLKNDVIEFIPELPKTKINAINSLGMGLLNKVYLPFPYVFWDNNVHFINYASNDIKGYWAEWLNLSAYTGAPILLGFNAGEFGSQLENLSDQEITEQAMDVLRKIYGEDIPNPTDILITRWGKDPFSFGAYSYLKIGAFPIMRETLAKPVNGRLFFAGEATSRDYPATVHGAYLSGLREAKRIIAK
ncbi:MAG: flavin monoamine oxidase family protein [Psychrobium sp.]